MKNCISFPCQGKAAKIDNPHRENMGWAVLSEKQNNSALRREALLWLQSGLTQKDGRLALFDGSGQRVSTAIQRAAIAQGWAEGWFANPMRPDWMICRLTPLGRQVLDGTHKAR